MSHTRKESYRLPLIATIHLVYEIVGGKQRGMVCAHNHSAQIKFHISTYKVCFDLILLVIEWIMMNSRNAKSSSLLRSTSIAKKNQEKDYRTNFLKSNITTTHNRN